MNLHQVWMPEQLQLLCVRWRMLLPLAGPRFAPYTNQALTYLRLLMRYSEVPFVDNIHPFTSKIYNMSLILYLNMQNNITPMQYHIWDLKWGLFLCSWFWWKPEDRLFIVECWAIIQINWLNIFRYAQTSSKVLTFHSGVWTDQWSSFFLFFFSCNSL